MNNGIISCKIGTHPSTHIRVRRIKRPLTVGEYFYGWELRTRQDWRMVKYRAKPIGYRWNRYLVEKATFLGTTPFYFVTQW